MAEAAEEEEEEEGGDKNDLVFWVAYQKHGNQNRYLGNGKGGVRLFKSRDILETYLREKLAPVDFERTVIHFVSGEFVVPEPEKSSAPLMVPITTLFPPTVPTAEELLVEVVKSRKRHPPKRRP